MKRTTKILAVLFILLAGTASIYFIWGGGANSKLSGWDRDFRVENTESIQKIFLADRRGNLTTLERSGDGWIYNGKYRANPNVMKNLLATIAEIELQSIPSSAAVEPMVKDLATHGIKVEIYGRGDKLLKAYYVGGVTQDERGTFMIMEGSNQPYVVQIPSMVGGIRVRYAITGDDWRDKTLFTMPPGDIVYASIEYPRLKNRSFILERSGDDFSIRPFYDVTPPIAAPYKKGSGERFLQGFENIVAEAFENDNPLRDTIVQRLPFSVITVKTKSGEELTLRLHPAKSSNKYLDEPPPVYEHYLVEVLPQNDFMLVQDRIITRILWGYDFFFVDETKK